MKRKLLQNSISVNSSSVVHRAVVRPVQMRYIRLYHQRSMTLISDLLIIVGIMMLFVALIFFWNHPITSNRHIDLQISLNSEQISGQDVSYKIHWKNNNRNSIEGVYMSIMPPKGFVMKEVLINGYIYQEENNLIIIDKLLPGANGEFEINGKTWVDTKIGAGWEIRLYYKNMGLKHNKTLHKNIEYSGSLLSSNISTLEKVYLNNNIPVNISVSNNSDEYLSSVYVDLQFPKDFEYIKSIYGIKDNTWYINGIKAGEKKELTIIGRLTHLDEAKVNFGIATGIISYDIDLLQNWQLVEADFILPKVDLDLSIDRHGSYILGQQYSSQVYYYNYGEYDLEDVQIRLFSSDTGLKTQFITQVYSYNKVKIDEENFLKSDFVIKRTNGDVNDSLAVWAELSWRNMLSEEPARIYMYSERKIIKVSPDLNLNAKLYYFTSGGDQIGYGPLPPVVGESTSYWISIRLWSSFGEVKNLELKTDLGKNTRLVDYNASLGSVIISDDIVWSLNSYNTSWQYQPQPRLNLHIEITPSADQMESNVLLLENLTASAISLINNSVIDIEVKQINNDMSGDQFRPNNGKITTW